MRRFAVHKEKQAKREAREAKEKEKKEKKKKEREEEERRGHPYYHEAAFLYAPPMFYAPVAAGCVAVHPGVVSHAGACGNVRIVFNSSVRYDITNYICHLGQRPMWRGWV